jgi:LAO/AO transport system kinase
MIKAGILEIADIFVVNKADLDGYQRVAMELRAMLSLNAPRATGAASKPWKPPILTTVAARQEGIDELWAAVESHRAYLDSSGRAQELAEKRLKDETAEVVADLARRQAMLALGEDGALTERLLKDGSPYRAAEEILDRIGRGPRKRAT